MDIPLDLIIALLGKLGSGKSATGNTILGRDEFKTLTRSCQKENADVDGRTISVIDTPGIFNTSMSVKQLKDEMIKCAVASYPGLHAFLLVIRLDVELTEEEKNIVRWVQNYFGNEASRYTFILFTHADQLNGEPLDEVISRRRDLQRLINSCGGRYHAFNNMNTESRVQVTELIQKIQRMVQINRGHHNTLEGIENNEESNDWWNFLINGIEIGGIVAGGGVALGVGLLGRHPVVALLAAAAALTGVILKIKRQNNQRF